MGAKAKTQYSCTECGATSSKWQGQCQGCGQWNTLVEALIESSQPAKRSFAALGGGSGVQMLSAIHPREEARQPTGWRNSIACSAAAWCPAAWC
jgi:DNA repair protein RadA/Sms